MRSEFVYNSARNKRVHRVVYYRYSWVRTRRVDWWGNRNNTRARITRRISPIRRPTGRVVPAFTPNCPPRAPEPLIARTHAYVGHKVTAPVQYRNVSKLRNEITVAVRPLPQPKNATVAQTAWSRVRSNETAIRVTARTLRVIAVYGLRNS